MRGAKICAVNRRLALNKNQINTLFRSFIVDTKADDGEHCEKSSIHDFLSTSNRCLQDDEFWELESDAEFQAGRSVKFKAKQ